MGRESRGCIAFFCNIITLNEFKDGWMMMTGKKKKEKEGGMDNGAAAGSFFFLFLMSRSGRTINTQIQCTYITLLSFHTYLNKDLKGRSE